MEHFNEIKKWDDLHCEKHVMNLVNNITELLRSKDITELYYIDIGANVGKVYDLLKDKNDLKKVWMYEASPLLFEYLKTKYESDDNVVLTHSAISNGEGLVPFDESSILYQIKNNVEEFNFGLSKIGNSPSELKVNSNKITNLIGNNREILDNVTFIKIDTENVDFFILDDLVSIIENFKTKPIIEFEVNYQSSTINRENAQSILDKYTSVGYKPLRLEDCWGDGILIPN
jgi:FkbM family methyltransferase